MSDSPELTRSSILDHLTETQEGAPKAEKQVSQELLEDAARFCRQFSEFVLRAAAEQLGEDERTTEVELNIPVKLSPVDESGNFGINVGPANINWNFKGKMPGPDRWWFG